MAFCGSDNSTTERDNNDRKEEDMRRIDSIIIHCSATKEGQEVTVKQIDGWHRERGFSEIGYHYVIGLDGRIWTGRAMFKMGAHCIGKNANSIGVCYIGGLDSSGKAKDTRTGKQKKAIKRLLIWLIWSYGELEIAGHNEYSGKECPCFNARKEYEGLYEELMSTGSDYIESSSCEYGLDKLIFP